MNQEKARTSHAIKKAQSDPERSGTAQRMAYVLFRAGFRRKQVERIVLAAVATGTVRCWRLLDAADIWEVEVPSRVD